MRIIHVTYRAEEYGIGTFLFSLLAFQKEKIKNDEVAIAFNAKGPYEYKFEKIGVRVYSMGLSSAKNIRVFTKFIRAFKKYDVIDLHSYSPWAFFAGIFLRKKIIYTFHGALGLRGGFQDHFVKAFHKFIINAYCKKITFASQSSLNRYLNGFNCRMNPKKMVIFPYGMQVDSIKSKMPRLEMRKELRLREQFVIGTASRIDPNKRLERLIEAFSILPEPEHFRLILMGKGDQRYNTFLNNEVSRLKLENQVQFLGFRSDVWEVINACDLFVLPSHNEPFGLALLEAMALGIPCAVFNDGGGAVDIIGDSGIIVKDAKELGEVILQLWRDQKLRDRIAMQVRERASKFDIKYTAGNLNKIYEDAMK